MLIQAFFFTNKNINNPEVVLPSPYSCTYWIILAETYLQEKKKKKQTQTKTKNHYKYFLTLEEK